MSSSNVAGDAILLSTFGIFWVTSGVESLCVSFLVSDCDADGNDGIDNNGDVLVWMFGKPARPSESYRLLFRRHPYVVYKSVYAFPPGVTGICEGLMIGYALASL